MHVSWHDKTHNKTIREEDIREHYQKEEIKMDRTCGSYGQGYYSQSSDDQDP